MRLLPWLQLCRAANLFTAWGDCLVGYWLMHDPGPGAGFTALWPGPLLLLLLASSCLYLAGMVWNDYFDRAVDAIERPQRPIPSGRISAAAAQRLGLGLITAGLLAAAGVSLHSLLTAGGLVAAIFLYDAWAKQHWFGPLVMGSCRSANLLLGASAPTHFVTTWTELPTWETYFFPIQLAVALGIYIAGVTWFAKREAGRSSLLPLVFGLVVADLGLGLLIARAATWPLVANRGLYAVLLLSMVAISINRRALAALQDPGPRPVQLTVKMMLLSLLFIDGALLLLVAPSIVPAIVCVLLIVPTLLLARVLAVT